MKMNRINVIFLYLVIVLSASCKNTPQQIIEVDEFGASSNLTGVKLNSEVELLMPKKMLLLNDTAIAVTDSKSDYGLKILKVQKSSIENWEQLGANGKGPNEILLDPNSLQTDVRKAMDGIWLSDIRWIQFHAYNSTTKTWNQNFSDIIKWPTGLIPASCSFLLNDDAILGNCTSIDKQIFIVRKDEKEWQGYNYYPLDPNPYNAKMSKLVFNADINLKPDKTKFVIAYNLFKSLSIVSVVNPTNFISLQFKNNRFPEILVSEISEIIPKLPIQYVKTYATNNFIYALYADKTVEEIEDIDNPNSQSFEIHVFKWDGTAKCRFQLDHQINCFCVDEKNSVIYGINPNTEGLSEFYEFDYSRELLEEPVVLGYLDVKSTSKYGMIPGEIIVRIKNPNKEKGMIKKISFKMFNAGDRKGIAAFKPQLYRPSAEPTEKLLPDSISPTFVTQRGKEVYLTFDVSKYKIDIQQGDIYVGLEYCGIKSNESDNEIVSQAMPCLIWKFEGTEPSFVKFNGKLEKEEEPTALNVGIELNPL